MPDNMSDALIEDTSLSVTSLGNECFICYEDMTDSDDVYTLPCCKKELHKNCLDKWHQDKVDDCKCPHCMETLYKKISNRDEEQVMIINSNTLIYERNQAVTICVTVSQNIAIFFFFIALIFVTFFRKKE